MSALTGRGSTAAWRRIRATYEQRLAYVGTVQCWRYTTNEAAVQAGTGVIVPIAEDCARIIRPGDQWVLGHKTDRALGGTDADLGYECRPCSDHTGGKLGALIRKMGNRQAGRDRGNIR